jgi:hypothetical protein
VCIIGMHRSGTSMVANLLQRAGLYLGEENDLHEATPANPAGYFEHLGLIWLNIEVLATVGASWNRPPSSGVDWDAGDLGPYRERARLLARPLRESPPWGWKDPRACLNIPFWRSAFGPLRFVVVVRNPLEVAFSLKRRNEFSLDFGLALWRDYAERILEDTSPEERIITHLDAYYLRPDREIARVLDFLHLDGKHDLAALRRVANPELRHHQKSLRDLEEFGVSLELIELYSLLLREAGHPDGERGIFQAPERCASSIH